MVDRSQEKFPSSYRQSHPRLLRSWSIDHWPVRTGLGHLRLSVDDRFRSFSCRRD